MTKDELLQIIDESSKELAEALTLEETKKLFNIDGKKASPEEIIVGASIFAIKVNQQLLFKVLSKVLCKD